MTLDCSGLIGFGGFGCLHRGSHCIDFGHLVLAQGEHLGRSAELGELRRHGSRLELRREDTNRSLAVAELRGDPVAVLLVEAEALVMKRVGGAMIANTRPMPAPFPVLRRPSL
jgi:hypothetical protein